MRKYATITLQVEADDGLPTFDYITEGMPILSIALTYTDDVYVDPAHRIKELEDELRPWRKIGTNPTYRT